MVFTLHDRVSRWRPVALPSPEVAVALAEIANATGQEAGLRHGSGEVLLASKVREVLLTEGATARSTGELPWRTSFEVGLALLRHQRNGATLKELAHVYVRDALKRWVPGAQLVHLDVEQDGPSLTLRVRVRERGQGDGVGDAVELRLSS